MSFRKRGAPIASAAKSLATPAATAAVERPPGTRPSHIDGRLTTSTGTYSLDLLLAGHGGLTLGNSLLIEENGITEYSGALLRYFAAEGVVQGHIVHVVGLGEQWTAELPGLIGDAEGSNESPQGAGEQSQMKIAWRYERLGEFGSESSGPRRDVRDSSASTAGPRMSFCHNFDLTKRLAIPSISPFRYIRLGSTSASDKDPLTEVLRSISTHIQNSSDASVHRIVIPSFLSPTVYPVSLYQPRHIISFFHGLRGLLRQHSSKVVAMMSLPLELFPRSTGLVRWMELLSDGVLELASFPHPAGMASEMTTSGAATAQEERPQGMLKIHRLPVYYERGCGGNGLGVSGDDLAFTVSRRKFVIKPFRLPPVEDDGNGQPESQGDQSLKQTKVDIEF